MTAAHPVHSTLVVLEHTQTSLKDFVIVQIWMKLAVACVATTHMHAPTPPD